MNDSLFLAINDLARATPWLHAPLLLFAGSIGLGLLGLLIAGAVVRSRRASDDALARAGWAALVPLVALAVNQPVVALIAERRPVTRFPEALILVAPTADPGFPSDHATVAGAVALALFLVSRRTGIIAAVIAALLAFSRVYVGAHYPLDVLVGLVWGAVIAGAGWLLLRRPLISLAGWLRRQAGWRTWFADPAYQVQQR